jgi:hypothetical protein
MADGGADIWPHHRFVIRDAPGQRSIGHADRSGSYALPRVGSGLVPQSDGVVFVYRSHYEGLLSKRVRRLPDRTALDWFRRGWAAAADPATDLEVWVATELGGRVYGLATIFDAARERELPMPATADELGAALAEHLYVEGEVVVEDDRVMALTDDDEVELAYFFLPAQAGGQVPERLAYLLYEDFPLPSGVSAGADTFAAPIDVGTLAPAGTGEGTTYAVLLTFYDGDSIGWLPPMAIPGVRLPGLAEYLRRVVPAGGRYACYTHELIEQERWPKELLALRGLVARGETSVESALHRCNRYLNIEDRLSAEFAGPYPAAHEAAMAKLATVTLDEKRDPERSVIDVADHIAQMSMHASGFFGHQQWFLFDDVWAATHPDLAASLMRYAASWNPYA